MSPENGNWFRGKGKCSSKSESFSPSLGFRLLPDGRKHLFPAVRHGFTGIICQMGQASFTIFTLSCCHRSFGGPGIDLGAVQRGMGRWS